MISMNPNGPGQPVTPTPTPPPATPSPIGGSPAPMPTAVPPQATQSTSPQNPQEKKKGSKKIIMIAIILLILAAVGAGAYFLLNMSRSSREEALPTPLSTPIPSTTPEPTPASKTYQSQTEGYSLSYPGDWILEEISDSNINGEPFSYIKITSPKSDYALLLGLRKKGETVKLSDRTGVGAGDFVPGTQATVAGTPVDTVNLVYQNSVKEIFYPSAASYFTVGNFEGYANFMSTATSNYDSINITNAPELATANQILASVKLPQ